MLEITLSIIKFRYKVALWRTKEVFLTKQWKYNVVLVPAGKVLKIMYSSLKLLD